MAETRLQLNVGADVTEAVTGVKLLEGQLERLQRIASLPNLSFRQQEKLNKLLITTQGQLNKFGNAAEIAGKKAGGVAGGANSASFALTNLGRVAQDAPFGFIGIQNNINPLLESFGRLKQETGSTGAALKALAGSFLGPAGLGVAVSLVTSAITFFVQAKQRARSETKALKEEEDVYVNTLAREGVQLKNLFAVATSANVPLKARTEAVKELRAQYGSYLKDFSDEEILAGKAAVAYQKLAAALINVARAQAGKAQQIDNAKKILANEEKIVKIREKAQKDAAATTGEIINGGGELFTINQAQAQRLIFQLAAKEAEALREENRGLEADQKRLADAILKNQVEPFKLAGGEVKKIANNVREVNDELQRTFTDLSKVVQQAAQIKNNLDPTILLPERRQRGVDINNANQTSSLVITPEALKRQGEYALLLDQISEKYARQLELTNQISSTISNGINQGIDTFFNALANNQDPFEALAQSAKRLVVELAAAVVKALALKAIASLLSSGTTTALDSLAGGLGGNGGGILSLILRGDLITGAVGGNASRRRRF